LRLTDLGCFGNIMESTMAKRFLYDVFLSHSSVDKSLVRRDNTMRLWDLEKQTCQHVFEGH